MSIWVIFKLPANIYERLSLSPSVTVQLVKSTLETRHGIPCELQILEFNGLKMHDKDTLHNAGVCSETEIVLTVDYLWKKLISLTLMGSLKSLGRRVSVPMQQINEENRVFVTIFISASKGMVASVKSLLEASRDFDLKCATKMTGRTVLHGAIASSSLKCVEEIKKRAGTEFENLLNIQDKSGNTALDYVCRSNVRMINYINKFISQQISIDSRIAVQHNHGNDNIDRENTFTLGREENEVTDIQKLDREKVDKIKLKNLKSINPQIRSVSPFKSEKIKADNSNRNEDQYNKSSAHGLPVIKRNTTMKSPQPPSREKKHKAVAGILTESNLRKFSGARHVRGSSDGEIILRNNSLAPRRSDKLRRKISGHETSPKTRRISRIKTPILSGSAENVRVIEIENERISKPWNSYIKAITVDIESEEGKGVINSSKIERKSSVQKRNDRKTSFDEWVLYKAQEQAASDRQKYAVQTSLEGERVETKGQTFEQWKKQKKEYEQEQKEKKRRDLEKLLDLQPEEEEANKKQRKTFEEWQKEREVKERKESIKRSQDIQKMKEEQRTQQERRRKDSSAKYQAWLKQKQIEKKEK